MAVVEESAAPDGVILFDSDGNILSSGTTLSGTTITDGGSMIVAAQGTADPRSRGGTGGELEHHGGGSGERGAPRGENGGGGAEKYGVRRNMETGNGGIGDGLAEAGGQADGGFFADYAGWEWAGNVWS